MRHALHQTLTLRVEVHDHELEFVLWHRSVQLVGQLCGRTVVEWLVGGSHGVELQDAVNPADDRTAAAHVLGSALESVENAVGG